MVRTIAGPLELDPVTALNGGSRLLYGRDAAAGRHAWCLETPELLLASRHDQLAASVERFLLIKDIGSQRLTPARFRLRCPPCIARFP